MNEDDLMVGVTDTARNLGWGWVHFRPARTAKGYRTPVEGPLGKGWPDLVLMHDQHGIRFVELKGDGGVMSAEQRMVMEAILPAIEAVCRAGISVYDPNQAGSVRVNKRLRYLVWTPRQYLDGSVERELRGQ